MSEKPTKTIREVAAQIAELLKQHRMMRPELNANVKRCKSTIDQALVLARFKGTVALVRKGHELWWCTPKDAHALRSEIALSKMSRPRVRKGPELDFDTIPDMPEVRRVVPATSLPMPHTKAVRWIFDIAA